MVLGWLFLTSGWLLSWSNLEWLAIVAYLGAAGSFIEALIDGYRNKK